MATGRDWRVTLFPASFKGVPFQTEKDLETGGRRIVTHEFPNREDPFNEDLGQKKRDFDVTAYLASDTADAQADALTGVCSARGAGVLVLPMQGAITVRCLDFNRSREKDRAGFVAYTMKFVREGAATALVSVASLANLVFAAADAIGPAVSAYAAATVAALGQPDFVIAAATDALQDGASILETLRTSENVDPVASGTQRDAIQSLFNAAPGAADRSTGVVGDTFAQLVTVARALGDAIPPANAVPAFEQVVVQTAVSPKDYYLSNAAQIADENRLAVYLAIRIAAATAYAEAIAQVDIPDRQTGITLRANAAEHFGDIMMAMSADDAGFGLYDAVLDISNATTDYLSRAILDLAPVVTVSANFRLPSLWWAHRLYQDPTRSTELAARNRVPHPSFMPLNFEALSR